MHAQVRQVGPGNCPICGMALEPEVSTGEAGPNPELVDFTRRFWIGLALTLPVLRPGDGRTPRSGWTTSSRRASTWLSSCSPPRPCSGRAGRSSCAAGSRGEPQPQHVHPDRARHRRGLGFQRGGHPRAGRVPARLPGHDGSVPVYFEAAAVIVVLVLLGQVLELRARERTGGAIRALLDLAPAMARRIRPTARRRRCRSPPWRSATACGSGRRQGAARRRGAGGRRQRGRVAWSPASRCRSRRLPAPR